MKKLLLSVAFVGVSMSCLMAQTVKQASNIYIVNGDGQVKLKAIDNTQAAGGLPWLEFGSQTNTAFLIPANGILPVAYGGTGTNSVAASKVALGIQSGTIVIGDDGSDTNTFSPIFSSVPIVVATQFGSINSTTNVITSITRSNFVIKTSEPGVTNKWIAVGAP